MLNKQKGNMYDFVSHTWNTIKGKCSHDCSYCYVKRWGKLNPVRFDLKELNQNLGENNFIFVGSSCDMFASDIPEQWINFTLNHCIQHNKNRYLFQTKNPERFLQFSDWFPKGSILVTTAESNLIYECNKKTPHPTDRLKYIKEVSKNHKTMITVEPVMDFNLNSFSKMLVNSGAYQINIGADSGGNGLIEPPKEKIFKLIDILRQNNIKVFEKKNLKRLLK
jgi:DNA repair photolyase